MKKPLIFSIDKQSSVPIYSQIVDQAKRRIAAGDLVSGILLPSVRRVARGLRVNPMTISKAYSILEREGVAERVPGKGLKVNDRSIITAYSPARKQAAVGMVFNGIIYAANPVFPPLLKGMNEAAEVKGYYLQPCPVKGGQVLAGENLFFASLLLQNAFAGLILMSPLSIADISELKKKRIPFVSQNNQYPALNIPCVINDIEQQVSQAAGCLVRKGHRRIGLVTGPAAYDYTTVVTSGFRVRTEFRRCLAAHGIAGESCPVRNIPWDRHKAFEAALEILSFSDRPSALIVCSNFQTEGVLRAIRKKGLAVPGDIEIVQIMSENGKGSPGLIIQSDLFEMGRQSMLMLDELIRKGSVAQRCRKITSRAILPSTEKKRAAG